MTDTRFSPTQKKSLSVIVPAYNEAQAIVPVLQELDETLRALSMPCRIIVVDDGSRDETAQNAASAGITTEEKFAFVTIDDSGCGIPESEHEKVFQRFYRGAMQLEEGSGIGLSIVSEIVRRLGGGITLGTPESGQGLRVRISLPVA